MVNKIFNKSCLIGLPELPEKSVNCCVTSPPYYGLRDYGHDEQIGMEETPEAFVQKLVEVFREVKRVLKDEGTLWLNLGDSYAHGQTNNGGCSEKSTLSGGGGKYRTGSKNEKQYNTNTPKKIKHGIKPKDLIGIPWMVAFALRADGWYLRQDIIWNKPNPMPESVTDRCTKSHEYIFLLSKSQQYYYDHEAIKNPVKDNWGTRDRTNGKYHQDGTGLQPHSGLEKEYEMANKRSVWTVTTRPYSEAHFATFPERLIVDCIKAGCPEGGLVLDPFMGAGTTAIVSRKLNRNYVGFEINPEYLKITEKRIASELGMFA